jgi:hypothetical protein
VRSDDYPDSELDEKTFTVVTAIGANERFTYESDFGDSWEHEITVRPSRIRSGTGERSPPDGSLMHRADVPWGKGGMGSISETGGRAVALHRDELSPEQLEHQLALDRSWAEAQRGLADPEFRAYLEESIRRLDAKVPAPLLTRDEFLAQTRDLAEGCPPGHRGAAPLDRTGVTVSRCAAGWPSLPRRDRRRSVAFAECPDRCSVEPA